MNKRLGRLRTRSFARKSHLGSTHDMFSSSHTSYQIQQWCYARAGDASSSPTWINTSKSFATQGTPQKSQDKYCLALGRTVCEGLDVPLSTFRCAVCLKVDNTTQSQLIQHEGYQHVHLHSLTRLSLCCPRQPISYAEAGFNVHSEPRASLERTLEMRRYAEFWASATNLPERVQRFCSRQRLTSQREELVFMSSANIFIAKATLVECTKHPT